MKITRKLFASLLALVMTVSVTAPAFAAQESEAAPSILDEISSADTGEAAYDEDEYVSIVVELATPAVMEVEEFADEYAVNSVGFAMSTTAAAYRAELAQEQSSIQQQVAEVCDNALFRYSYTNLINGFNAYVQYGDISAIESIDGVSAVYVTEQYSAEDLWEDETDSQEFVSLEKYYALTGQTGVDLGSSTDSANADSGSMSQMGLYEAWENGYTGAGKVAAIFDSGLYSDNQLFQYYDLEALQEAYPDLNLDYDVNGGTVRTKEGILKILQANKATMNIYQSSWSDWFHSWEGQYPEALTSGFGENVSEEIDAGAFFTNEKVPFNVDYANGDFNTWVEDTATETTPAYTSVHRHGTHVAGITAGNAGPDKESLGVKGTAYDAQIFFFKVFKEQDGSSQEGDEDVFAALDDAVTLGVNVFNLSLGIPNGFTTCNTLAQAGYQRAYNSARNAGISIAVSAGNDARESRPGNDLGTNGGYTTVLPNNSRIGASGSLFSPFTVASAQGLGYSAWNGNNAPQTTATFTSGDETVLSLTLDDNNGPDSLGEVLTGSYELVWAGTKAEVAEAAENAYEGRIAVVELTTAREYNVVRDVIEKGAVAAVVINYSNSNTKLSVSYLVSGLAFGALSTDNGSKLKTTMAAGTVTVSFSTEENDKANQKAAIYYDMGPSSFTSWGVTDALRLTPDIMAPGGNILSAGVENPNSMAVLSGTSMASPNMAGCFLLVQQYADTLIAEGGPLDDEISAGTLSYATLVDNLVGSTALPYMPYENSASRGSYMRDGEDGRLNAYFSPRRQGAGMAQMDKATSTKAYLTSTMEVGYNLATGESQRAKIELGELGNVQEFTMSYQVVNLDTKAHNFQIETAVQTDATTLASNGRYNLVSVNSYGTDVDTIDGAVVTVESITGGRLVSVSENTNRYSEVSAPASVRVPASSTAVVTLKVTLPDMTDYDAIYVNGMFIEGYIFMYDTTRKAVTTDLSIPFMGFRGDWNDAPVFDTATAYDDISGKSVSDLDYPVYHIDNLHTRNTVDGKTTEAVLGANQFTGTAVPAFDHASAAKSSPVVADMRDYLDTLRKDGNLSGDWSAISPNGDGLADDVYAQFGLLRNAKVLGVQIVDADGNVVKDLGYEYEYFKLLASDSGLSQLVSTTAHDKYGHNLNWDGTDNDSNVVADGQYYYKMNALLEYDYLALVNENTVRGKLNEFMKSLDRTDSLVNGVELRSIQNKLDELVGEKLKTLLDESGHTVSMPVKVDTEAPVITSEPLDDDKWIVHVSDAGSGVQAVVLYYDGVKVGDVVRINAKEGDATFDLSGMGEIDTAKLDIQAVDYAMNVTELQANDAKVVVTLNLSGESKATTCDKTLSYKVSVENAVRLATVSVKVTLDAKYAGQPVVVEANEAAGFRYISSTFQETDGKLEGTVVVFNQAGLTAEADTEMFTITVPNNGVTGTATAALRSGKAGAYVGSGDETFVDVVLGNSGVTTEISYLIYDVNHDGVVNQLDITHAQRYFGKANPDCDVSGNGKVDIADLILILQNYTV